MGQIDEFNVYAEDEDTEKKTAGTFDFINPY